VTTAITPLIVQPVGLTVFAGIDIRRATPSPAKLVEQRSHVGAPWSLLQ
jgi:hypothetical protein